MKLENLVLNQDNFFNFLVKLKYNLMNRFNFILDCLTTYIQILLNTLKIFIVHYSILIIDSVDIYDS